MVGKEDVCLSYWVSVTFQGRTVKLQGGKWNSPLFCLRLGRFLRFSWILKLPSQQIPISSGIFWNGNRVANRLKQAANTGENRFSIGTSIFWGAKNYSQMNVFQNTSQHHSNFFFWNIIRIFFGLIYSRCFFSTKKINQTPNKNHGGISHQPETPDIEGRRLSNFHLTPTSYFGPPRKDQVSWDLRDLFDGKPLHGFFISDHKGPRLFLGGYVPENGGS